MNKNTDVPFHARHEDELLTLDEVAEILQTSPNTVRWWRHIGARPEFFKTGRRLYTTVGTCAAGSASSGSPPSPSSADRRRCDRDG
jgi:hypothetical protein